MTIEFKLPELGEGIDSGDVLSVLVKVGDAIVPEQGIVELETEKATVEVPCPYAGRVTQVHVSEGQTVAIGATLITLDEVAAPTKSPPATPPSAASPTKSAGTTPGMASTSTKSTPTKAPSATPTSAATAPSRPAPASSVAPALVPIAPAVAKTAVGAIAPSRINPAAGPATRRFARELGVDLTRVVGTGANDRITRDDVIAVVRQSNQMAVGPASPAGPAATIPRSVTSPPAERSPAATDVGLPDVGTPGVDAWGPTRRDRMTRIRRTIAARMHESSSTIPHVTNFDDADVTRLEKHRQDSKEDYARSGIKLTTLPFLIKAVALCLRRHPVVNATLDLEHEEIVYKDYVNVGVAVDTERGLVVPVLRGVDRMSLPDIVRALASMAEKARSNDFTLDDLRGGTFTISNLGAIGGTYSTPIINSPEAAILLAGRARKMPVVVHDEVHIRLMLPLSLSYDHRLVDGAAAARFLNEVIEYLEAPTRLLLAP